MVESRTHLGRRSGDEVSASHIGSIYLEDHQPALVNVGEEIATA